jgi:hypothetical protein
MHIDTTTAMMTYFVSAEAKTGSALETRQNANSELINPQATNPTVTEAECSVMRRRQLSRRVESSRYRDNSRPRDIRKLSRSRLEGS